MTWCPLPWSHLSVKNNGTLRLCSHSQSVGGNSILRQQGKSLMLEDLNNVDVLNSDTLKEIRKDFMTGNWPAQCNRCQVESKSGKLSRNKWETEKHKNVLTKDQALNNTLSDGTIQNSKFLTYDLRVGFQCNLRCAMCFPAESSRWYRDYKELTQQDTFRVDDKLYDLDIKNADFDWAKSEEQVNGLISAGKYVQKITFGGGEPLLIKHCHTMVEKLVEAGYAKNIELEYSTNMTVFPEQLWDLWKNFKKVVFCCSIDAYGVVNEAIRYPSKWSTVERNLDMLDNTPDNISAFTSTTISVLNLEHYADFMLWLDSKNYKKINKEAFKFSATHPVYYDRCLNIAIMEEEDLYEITTTMKTKLEQSNAKQKKFMISWINFYENFYRNTKIEDVESHRKEFADRFYKFAKNQNQDWDKIFPMGSKMARKWQ